jgi:hypothetical protein
MAAPGKRLYLEDEHPSTFSRRTVRAFQDQPTGFSPISAAKHGHEINLEFSAMRPR